MERREVERGVCEYLTTGDNGCTRLTRKEVKNQVSDEGGVQGEGR
jgi:hypothetical protein